jgi:formylglycine-generating enzyme required for sulfatase activity
MIGEVGQVAPGIGAAPGLRAMFALRALLLLPGAALGTSGCLLADGVFGDSSCPAQGTCPAIEWRFSAPASVEFTVSEVTVAQYEACVNAGVCGEPFHPSCGSGSWSSRSSCGDCPMNCVSPLEADEFCEWLRARLPTEEEWYAEASNGGSREYPWGDEEPSCERTVYESTHCGPQSFWPVCSRPMGHSVSGLCDMTGSLGEWTSPGEGEDADLRVCRAGSLCNSNSGGGTVGLLARHSYSPTSAAWAIGFRCARPPG